MQALHNNIRLNTQRINRYKVYKQRSQWLLDRYQNGKKSKQNLPSASFINSSHDSQEESSEDNKGSKMTKELSPQRKSYNARTRTLIQLGGLVDKAGLLPYVGLSLGDDLQQDERTFDAAATLLGVFMEMQKQLQENPPDDSIQYVWRLKGKKALRN